MAEPQGVVRWNTDKWHRCPTCHTIVDTGPPATWRAVYQCCRCGVRFARWPSLSWFLPVRTCKEIPSGTCPNSKPKADQ